ncbi:hypothetical protein COLO4_12818 [Corchorus olitorius]|uniref:Uncharacterized protein n=1 Tax=Corchorus olitorius TaxID=93759 RepID=A0A1R3JZR3_9ROSI|nr:hypothetical protein COLO4_12818 [Corchorus olitorius]
MGRKPCSKEEGLNRGAWTAIEDKILIDYIKLHGEGKWRTLPKAAVKEAIRKDDNFNVMDETALESESSDGSFALPSSVDEENKALSNFRMDFDVGEISNVSEGFASDLNQLCGYDFTDMNAEMCEYGKNDYVELEANNFNLDSDFGFLDAFLESNIEDLNVT